MRVAIPSLPQYAFMAWCSVKEAQRQLYFLVVGDVVNFTSRLLYLWLKDSGTHWIGDNICFVKIGIADRNTK
jgi:hypothetical protein